MTSEDTGPTRKETRIFEAAQHEPWGSPVDHIQNFDDHDRSGRYTARDFAWNYLNSCAPGAILFTYGDNDTFHLLCIPEREGVVVTIG
ncbi:MAG: hypothetical protein R6V12_09965, partial [Candidatus Hydrogenedentota bacterium]